jgi:hypothetical protein
VFCGVSVDGFLARPNHNWNTILAIVRILKSQAGGVMLSKTAPSPNIFEESWLGVRFVAGFADPFFMMHVH